MANYKGFDVLDETDVRPWGARDAQQEKDQIDTMVMDCVTQAADTVNGHRHYRIWQSDGGAEAVSADADGLITIPEHVGIGIAPNEFIHLHIKDTSVAATAYYMGIYSFHLVDDASGATDATNLFAFYNEFTLDSTGETVGTLKGIYNSVTLTDGSIGSGSDDLYGVDNRIAVVAGTASRDVYGINNSLIFNGGTITGDILGAKTLIDIASGVTSIGGSVTGNLIDMDVNEPSIAGHVYGFDIDLDVTANIGSTSDIFGLRCSVNFNENGSACGNMYSGWFSAELVNGTVGNISESLICLYTEAKLTTGTVENDLIGIYNWVNAFSGTVDDSMYGMWTQVEAKVGLTYVNNIFGHYISVDDDKGAEGTVYMLYLKEFTGVTYGIYQNGSAENRFGGVVNAIGGFEDSGVAGIDTTWVNNEGDTVTVSGGIITDVS